VDRLNINVDLPSFDSLPQVVNQVSKVSPINGDLQKGLLAFTEGIREVSASLDVIRSSADHFKGESKLAALPSVVKRSSSDPGLLRKGAEGDDDDEDGLGTIERIMRYRFVRKIEPDLPPIGSLGKTGVGFLKSVPMPSKCGDHIIVKNASPAYLQTWLPREREKLMAMRTIDGNRRMHAVRQRAKELDSHTLEARVEGLLRLEARQQEIDINRKNRHRGDMRQKAYEGWQTAFAFVGFILECRALVTKYHQAREVFSKEMGHDGVLQMKGLTTQLSTHILVDQFVRMARMKRQCCRELAAAGDSSAGINLEPESRAWNQTAFVQTFILCKMRVRLRRSRGNKILDALVSWKRTGPLLVTMKRFRRKVLKIQRFWRWCRHHLAKVCATITHQWIAVERTFLSEKFERAASRTGSRGKQNVSREGHRPSVGRHSRISLSEQHLTLGLEERVDVAMLDKHHRHRFLVAELRVCRFEALPAIKHWEEQMQIYKDQVKQWRETSAACKVMGATNTMHMPIMPPCPETLPTRPQLFDMVERAHMAHAHPRQVKAVRKRSKETTGATQKTDFLVLSQPTPPGSPQSIRRPSDADPNLPSPLCLL
jgi:hypothetical protein